MRSAAFGYGVLRGLRDVTVTTSSGTHRLLDDVDYISAVSGGPLKYEGRPMKPAHQGMGITDAQFDTLAGDLGVVLQRYNVPKKEADELLAIIASTRKDVVEAGPRPPGQ